MEIKVFRDVSKKENTKGGLTVPQWLFIIGLVLLIAVTIANAVYQVVPDGLVRIILFPLIGFLAVNALYRPYGLSFNTWLKLFIKFQTTIQTRTYQKENERVNVYGSKDFKENKNIKEAKQR